MEGSKNGRTGFEARTNQRQGKANRQQSLPCCRMKARTEKSRQLLRIADGHISGSEEIEPGGDNIGPVVQNVTGDLFQVILRYLAFVVI